MSHLVGNGGNAAGNERTRLAPFAIALVVGSLVGSAASAQADTPMIVHDAEYYILDAQYGEKWAVENKNLDKKLADLRKKYGTPPNIIHVLFDDTPGARIRHGAESR